MDYTISDFFHTFSGKVRLVAGMGGLSRRVIDVGILDYELEIGLKDRYLHTNFHEEQLIVTTFLYAKDNPFLISDAVKHLVQKGTSGLVIKNVFRLSIPDSVLRFADSRNFPIFIIESREVYFEEIIYEVNRRRELVADEQYQRNQLALLLSQKLTDEEIVRRVRDICPSCCSEFFALFLMFDANSNISDYQRCYQRFASSQLNRPGNALLPYQTGVFFVCSHESAMPSFDDETIEEILQILSPQKTFGSAGVSSKHLKLEEFPVAAIESTYAAQANVAYEKAFQRYDDLGTYQVLFPFCESREMRMFSHKVLGAISDYDAEYGTHLLEALEQFVYQDCNLNTTADNLGLHKNTIRYRLEKIYEITNLDYRSFPDMEQLSLATKIRKISRGAEESRQQNDLALLQ